MEKELAEILKDLGLENNTWKKKVLAPYIKRIIALFEKYGKVYEQTISN